MDAIVVKDVTKRYRVYPRPIDRLREVLTLNRRCFHREFTAVEGFNLTVEKGKALGIIGPNGAGKSTLLKMMAGIIDPSEGHVAVQGRVASIIELGTGFHGEFSGRDNVYMNAAIMGYRSEQVDAFFDEIARFAELGSYMDMPVKTYSSGMFVRLAFAIATHVEPEVFLVDEALAVGDAVFAHRCTQRIREMKARGATICFVSHDVNAVQGLCDEAILLDRGQLIDRGTPKHVIQRYQAIVAERIARMAGEGDRGTAEFHTIGAAETSDEVGENRFGTFEARIVRTEVRDGNDRPATKLLSGDDVTFAIDVEFHEDLDDPVFGIMIRNRYGIEVFGTNSYLRNEQTGRFPRGRTVRVRFRAPLNIGVGSYTVSFAVHTPAGHFYDYRQDNMVIEVLGPIPSIGMAVMPLEIEVDRGGDTANR